MARRGRALTAHIGLEPDVASGSIGMAFPRCYQHIILFPSRPAVDAAPSKNLSSSLDHIEVAGAYDACPWKPDPGPRCLSGSPAWTMSARAAGSQRQMLEPRPSPLYVILVSAARRSGLGSSGIGSCMNPISRGSYQRSSLYRGLADWAGL